jgi:hypothetical protein
VGVAEGINGLSNGRRKAQAIDKDKENEIYEAGA